MPLYQYECGYCNKIMEVKHSMQENYTGYDCPKCKAKESLHKLPSYFTKFYKNDGTIRQDKKVGDVVKAAIEEMSEDLYSYEEQLLEEIYENDNDSN